MSMSSNETSSRGANPALESEVMEDGLICPAYKDVDVDREITELLQIPNVLLVLRSDRTIEFCGPDTIISVTPSAKEPTLNSSGSACRSSPAGLPTLQEVLLEWE